MFKNSQHSIIQKISQLLLFSSLITVFFGQGAHLHTVFEHFSEHGDIHASFHAHSNDFPITEKNSHAEDENHQHEVSSIDICGVLASGAKADVIIESTPNLFLSTAIISAEFDEQSEYLFDLPPPDKPFNQYHSLSFSLRGPPVA